MLRYALSMATRSHAPFSIRMRPETHERLERHSRWGGTSKSELAQRLIDEGLRMEEHPGIVFRDGPTGRRAALTAGPDVWEVIETIASGDDEGQDAIVATAEWANLSVAAVRTAVNYYADYRQEIDDRIAANREEADRQYSAWLRAQEALA